MSGTRRRQRLGLALELAVCTILVTIIALAASRRMGYLDSATSETARMTDESRSAYVAKNLADGNGYTTNDLPAALVDFYDQRGKLHTDHWPNADRFPFASYATALLYKVTGSTSWVVGILVYNVLFFVAFLVLLYQTARSIWSDRYAGLWAVTLALLHPYTYVFLYAKDGDMLFLTTACIALLARYFRAPRGSLSIWFQLLLGTVLAFMFLSRPNLGAPFILGFGITALHRCWRARREVGWGRALKHHLLREGVALGVAALWCVPFVIHSLGEWGSPLFSANNLYQLPLGTRFGMGTDTWWKYTEPGTTVTLSTLLHHAPGQLATKFTSSWVATLKTVVGAYGVEIALAVGAFAWLRRQPDDGGETPEQVSTVKRTWAVVGFALLMNLALLPLYGYQSYSYRHYMGFGLPLLWIVSGKALSLIGPTLVAGVRRVIAHVNAHRVMYALVAVVGVLAWNIASSEPDANRLFGRTAKLLGTHWLTGLLVLGVLAFRRKLLRPPWFPRIVVVAFSLVYACYRPYVGLKRSNVLFFPTDERVWDGMRTRHGIVSSFALQGEVAWNTGRQNIPAPEWPMHVYSFAYDHALTIEDLYIESAQALISPIDGPFGVAAPGFEGYVRLQRYPTMPGYTLDFQSSGSRALPEYRIKSHPKASTVFRLADPAAIQAMAHSPTRIDLGDPKQVIYTAHGWGGYYAIDGKAVVAATDATRSRYAPGIEKPWEDTGVTFFLDDRRPTAVDLDLYAPVAATYQFYWNLDLYAYDLPGDRAAHAVGTVTAAGPGWQHVHLPVPPAVTRRGLNKLGFRSSVIQPVVACPEGTSDAACLSAPELHERPDPEKEKEPAAVVVRTSGSGGAEVMRASAFAAAIEFTY